MRNRPPSNFTYQQATGAQLKYLVEYGQRPIGGLSFGPAAWKVAARDQYTGWSAMSSLAKANGWLCWDGPPLPSTSKIEKGSVPSIDDCASSRQARRMASVVSTEGMGSTAGRLRMGSRHYVTQLLYQERRAGRRRG
jgi:hypothetical protein